MEVIFKGVKEGEEKPINLEEGKLYWANKERDMGGSRFEYHIKIDEHHMGIYPTRWFINLTELETKYSATRGILSQPVSIGGGMGAEITTLCKDSSGAFQKLCTSPVVMAEEIAHNWILFKTSSEHYYIGHLSEN